MCKKIDLARATASGLQTLLNSGEITSVDLVKQSLEQIELHNTRGLNLRALISVAPEKLALARAAELDVERAASKLRDSLHGIPILVKDVVQTHSQLGMPTTVGSLALASAQVHSNATVVDKLHDSGLIILGKTNLNANSIPQEELSSWKGMGPMNGWSAASGQTNSAYVPGGLIKGDGVMGHSNPYGASTGSAVGVSAGFSPIAIGTEVDGSLTQPAARASLYALKPTVGSTELGGIFAVSAEFDCVGAMAKSSHDLAMLSELSLKPRAREKLPEDGYLSFSKSTFEGLNIGFVDPEIWRWPETFQPQHGNSLEELESLLASGYTEARDLVTRYQAKAVYPVSLPPVADFVLDGQPCTIMAIRHVFKRNVDSYLESLTTSEVRTLEDIIQYNKDHSDQELPRGIVYLHASGHSRSWLTIATTAFPEQGRLIGTLENPIDQDMYEQAVKQCRTVAQDRGVDKVMKENNLDLIAFPMDSPCPRVAAAAGYPIATVPLGTLRYNGRPFGLAIVAQAGREDLLFTFMSAWEACAKPRAVPSSL
ncbi:Amidase signature domain protein [Akanthomyces lecanii RCEF 1005]|uniref:Amidase signature domain protein n=1 Tax=Akanthomyces lecanii RCEF 1005 TaxID=1081108 RepID=A0A162KLE4_CORDF|nr:Amidase signature domain protein [Akanthomyces lecanii RCEF 1005]